MRRGSILLDIDGLASRLFTSTKFRLYSRNHFIDHHLSMLISINGLFCELFCSSWSVDTCSLCHSVLANRSDANLTIPPHAVVQSSWPCLSTQEHDFCNVAFVTYISLWWLFSIDDNVVLSISAQIEPLLVDVCFIVKGLELGLWRAASSSGGCCS